MAPKRRGAPLQVYRTGHEKLVRQAEDDAQRAFEHRARVRYEDGTLKCVCPCGWVGPQRDTGREAEADGKVHGKQIQEILKACVMDLLSQKPMTSAEVHRAINKMTAEEQVAALRKWGKANA